MVRSWRIAELAQSISRPTATQGIDSSDVQRFHFGQFGYSRIAQECWSPKTFLALQYTRVSSGDMAFVSVRVPVAAPPLSPSVAAGAGVAQAACAHEPAYLSWRSRSKARAHARGFGNGCSERSGRGSNRFVLSAIASSADYLARHDLSGRTAVVTGGNRGIGAAISHALAAHGADVLIVARDEASSLEVLRELRETHGVQGAFVACDLSDAASVARVTPQCVAASPSTLNILVNNAGVALLAPLRDASVVDWDTTMAVNLRAPYILAQHLATHMMDAGTAGAIVNVSSAAGKGALHEHGAYCTSKAALNMLTKVMALEWGPSGVRTNAVCPTVILTDMGQKVWGPTEKAAPMLARIPLGRFGQPYEVGDLVAYLCSDAASLINGQLISADGGFSVQ
ncbi:L-xylulose reductase [Porphyridium purpureum]|uniref:L-xylulose reductase n=1 Tax=Porphyridium purpureum TaxID=35688 RepID=A0A5J4YVE1_PORPP|nr:L-xylulose reductase [Porphyridium purpureum]|eukprot:POR0983..scf227_4